MADQYRPAIQLGPQIYSLLVSASVGIAVGGWKYWSHLIKGLLAMAVRPPTPKKTMAFPFDLDVYLNGVGDGQSILNLKRNEAVFAQGDAAKSVFYIRKGRVNIAVVSENG
jgi:hypothetical protein